MSDSAKVKVALVVSHPIQHFCPQYVSFAGHPGIEFKVFFASTMGLEKYVDPNFKKEISWGNLELSSFQHEFLNDRRNLPSNAELDAPDLERQLSIFAPDIVVTYGYFQKLSRRAYRWANSKRIPVAYISDSEFRHRQSGWKEFAKRIWRARYFAKINYFLTVGNANEEFYARHGVNPNKFVRMHFPIDVRAYDASFARRAELRRAVREKLGIGTDRFVASVVGKLVPWKNQDDLIRAIDSLSQRHANLDLLVVGSGAMESAWAEMARKVAGARIHMTSFVGIDELPGYYAASDVYVHPASKEPHSIAISEAIAMGLPIVCSSRCGSYGESDDVQEERNGLVYEFGNIPQLVEKIERLIVDSKLRLGMGEYSRTLSEKFQSIAHGGVIDTLLSKRLR